jgi:hypothetical protein
VLSRLYEFELLFNSVSFEENFMNFFRALGLGFLVNFLAMSAVLCTGDDVIKSLLPESQRIIYNNGIVELYSPVLTSRMEKEAAVCFVVMGVIMPITLSSLLLTHPDFSRLPESAKYFGSSVCVAGGLFSIAHGIEKYFNADQIKEKPKLVISDAGIVIHDGKSFTWREIVEIKKNMYQVVSPEKNTVISSGEVLKCFDEYGSVVFSTNGYDLPLSVAALETLLKYYHEKSAQSQEATASKLG